MTKNIPDGLKRKHVLNAIQDLDSGFEHNFGKATGYHLLYKGKAYAPKAVVGIAFRHVTGRILHHDEFSGGESKGKANYVLRELGFDVVPFGIGEPSKSYILTWNPSKWNEWDYDAAVATTESGEVFNDHWSTGNRKTMHPGERVYLMRQGDNQGLIGAGHTTSEIYEAPHWDGSGKIICNVFVDFETLLPVSNVLGVDNLLAHDLKISWNNILASGNAVPPQSTEVLERIWKKHLLSIGRQQDRSPNEVASPSRYFEGAVKKSYVNSYERNSRARQQCIAHYGHNCSVCGFNFGAVYGNLGNGFIHVHHLRDLASIGEEYEVDPIEDLRPVCPNCHAMLHRSKETLSIEALSKMIK